MNNYLAIDIGASSGRAIVASLDEKLVLEEVNRFSIDVEKINGKLRLNLEKLISDIEESIIKATEKYTIKSMGIDTWAVDFVAIDKEGTVVERPMFYRDQSFIDELARIRKEDESQIYDLYCQTGIQIQPFNTYYQLNVLGENYDEEKIHELLMLPDYLNYYFTGEKASEFTNLTSTACFQADTFEPLHPKAKLFAPQRKSRLLGNVLEQYANNQEIKVTMVASHDTASAHVGIPNLNETTAFISSGTWSLLGVDISAPQTIERSYQYNFTNEGSYSGKYRHQKNIMGLWMIVSYAREINNSDFAYLNSLAAESTLDTIIDVNNQVFFNPISMRQAILDYCEEKKLEKPTEEKDFCRIIYRSLAKSYADTIDQLEEVIKTTIDNIVIAGGGSKATFLNKMTKEFTKKNILVFPYESSALGNVIVQAIEQRQFATIKDAHNYITKSFELKELE